jgi:hypothetical protein
VTSDKNRVKPADLPIRDMLVKLLDPFLKLAEQPPPEVQAGSTMRRLDDALGDPFQLSHLVAGAQVKAIDHLVASRNLIFKAGTFHPWAALSLARGALETSATAAWLLSSPEDTDRFQRSLRLSHHDLLDQIEFEKRFDSPEERSFRDLLDTAEFETGSPADRIARFEERRARALQKAVDLSLDKSGVARPLRWVTLLDMVGNELQPKLRRKLSPLLIWKLLSGVAHGRQWASLTGLQKEIVADHADGTVTIKQTTNEATLFYALETAVVLFDESARAYKESRLVWTASPGRGSSA